MLHHDQEIPLLHHLTSRLSTNRFGRPCKSFTSVGSTNTVAVQWANEGAEEGSLVLADHQTSGRGRLNRTWEDTPGQNVLFSLILRPALPPAERGRLMMAASVAIAQTIDQFTSPLETKIKWPNDVLLNDRKCCGILMESPAPAGGQKHGPVILGVGINVNQEQFATLNATSLLLETGQRVDRSNLLAVLLASLERHYQHLFEPEHDGIQRAYVNRMAYLRRSVRLQLKEESVVAEGVVEGVSKLGGLQIRSEKGLEVHYAGEVTRTRMAI